MKKGQISIEFIIILTLLFFVLLFSFAIFSERTTGLIHSQELSESKLVANKIARTINSVVLAGNGVETELLLEKRFDYNVTFFENSVRVHFRDQFVSVPIVTSDINKSSLTPGGFVKISNQNGQILIEDIVKVILKLSITQDSYSVTLEESESNIDTFQLCNNSTVTLNNIAFSDSGTIATWIDSLATISSLTPSACQNVSFTINVPLFQADGDYTGTITATDDNGAGSNTDSLAITVTVSTPSLDVTPPVVLLEAPASGYDDADGTIQFDYNVVDTESGITSCSLLINGSVDQTDITITENVTQSFTKVGLTDGAYTWDVECTDDSSNANAGSSSESRPFTVTSVGECSTQAVCFSQAWNSSTFTCQTSGNPGNRYCQLSETAPFWTIQNTSSGTTITIARIMISWTGDTDGDSDVDVIVIDTVQRNSISSASGVWNDITDFSLTAGQTMTTNNWLRWEGSAAAGRMDNETETYTLQFEFTDASTFTTTSYNPV